MSKSRVQKFEYSALKVGEDGFNESHFIQLVKLNELHNNQYFSIGHKRIHFTHYVGVIQVGNFIIEILPKADIGEADTQKWQKAFLTMLRESGLLNIHAPTYADLMLKDVSILDLFFEQFISEVENLIHAGLIKKYRTIKRNSNALKGKLVFKENLKHNLIHKERFFTQHQVYDRNNVFNQIIAKAARLLPLVISNSTLLSRANNILLDLEDIEDINISENSFDSLSFDRKTEGYKQAILIAKMILLNYSPDIKGGANNVLSLLFDMNDVFERFIYRRLKKSESQFYEYGLEVKFQQSKKFWNSKSIRPDIIVEYKEDDVVESVVIDTKWKVLRDLAPSDADLKQMYAYNLHFGAKKSYLLYPKVFEFKHDSGKYHNSIAVKREYENHQCQLYFVDMFDGESLRSDMGERILWEIISSILN